MVSSFGTFWSVKVFVGEASLDYGRHLDTDVSVDVVEF